MQRRLTALTNDECSQTAALADVADAAADVSCGSATFVTRIENVMMLAETETAPTRMAKRQKFSKSGTGDNERRAEEAFF